MDIKKELSENQTILLVLSGINYNKEITDVVKKIDDKNIAYITLNKTNESLREIFKKAKVNTKNIVFVDAISKTIKDVPDQGEGVYYVSSPGALTEMSIVISKFIRHNFDYIIFDSLTNLLIYENKIVVSKFFSSLISKLKESSTKAVFYALEVKEQESLIKESGMLVDKVLGLEKR